MSSALVTRYETSPNSETAGCMVTGEAGPGIVLNHVRTLTNEFVFIGETAVTEAYAEMSGMTVAELKKLRKATEEIKQLKINLDVFGKRLKAWEAFGDRMEEAGLIIRELE